MKLRPVLLKHRLAELLCTPSISTETVLLIRELKKVQNYHLLVSKKLKRTLVSILSIILPQFLLMSYYIYTLRETCINYTCVNFALIVEDNKSSEQKKPKRRKRKLINEKQGRKSSTNKGYTIIHCNVCLLNLKIYTENQEPIKGTKKSKKNGSKASKKKSGN